MTMFIHNSNVAMGNVCIMQFIFSYLLISHLFHFKNCTHIVIEWTRICLFLSFEFWNYFLADKFHLSWKYFLCFSKYFPGSFHFLVHLTILLPFPIDHVTCLGQQNAKKALYVTYEWKLSKQWLMCHPVSFNLPQQQEICQAVAALSAWA